MYVDPWRKEGKLDFPSSMVDLTQIMQSGQIVLSHVLELKWLITKVLINTNSAHHFAFVNWQLSVMQDETRQGVLGQNCWS